MAATSLTKVIFREKVFVDSAYIEIAHAADYTSITLDADATGLVIKLVNDNGTFVVPWTLVCGAAVDV